MTRIKEECGEYLKDKISDEYRILNNVKIIDYEGNITKNMEFVIYNKKCEKNIYGNLIYLEAVSMVVKCNNDSENFEDELINWSESIKDLKHKFENIIDENGKKIKPVPIIAVYGRNNLDEIENFIHIALNKNEDIYYSEMLPNLYQIFYKLNYDGKTSQGAKKIIENLEVYKNMKENKKKFKKNASNNEINELLGTKLADLCLNDGREKKIINNKKNILTKNIDTKNIVGFHVDKIQNFLFSAINSQNNDSEKEELKQKMILNSSDKISRDLYDIIEEKFSIEEKEKILVKTSGKYIFGTDLDTNVIDKKCKEIFEYFYKISNGQIFLLYTWCNNGVNLENKEKLDLCIKKLKSSKNYNELLKNNADVLFCLSQNVSNSKSEINNRKKWEGFVNELDDLNENESNGDSGRSRIAVIKADLDGMGELFRNLKSYEEFKTISELLNIYISIEEMDKYIKNQEIKVFPFYIAGDDIFLACRVKDIFNVVEVLKKFLKNLNSKINSNLEKEIVLTMCIGIEITENKQPIRFFYERVEKQLEIAKREKEKNKLIMIGFYNRYFQYHEWNTMKSQIFFIQTLKNQNDEKMAGIKVISTTYLYNLYRILLSLSNENSIKFRNLFFYQIFPEYIEDKNELKYKLDMSLKSFIFFNSYKNNSLNRTFIENLKLIILFLDKRYSVDLNSNNYFNINKKYHFHKEIKRNFIKKIMEEIFENNFCKNKNLRDQFLKKKGEDYKLLYKVGVSTLFRLKREILSERNNVQKIKNLLLNITKRSESTDKLNNGESQRKNQSMYFSFDKNSNINKNDLDENFVDSVIVFYKYRIAYKKISAKINENRGGRNGR